LSLKLRRVAHGWRYLAALEFFELNIGELPGRLDMLVAALEPRFAQKTVANKSGAWFAGLETAQPKIVRIDDVAQMFRSLYPRRRAAEGVVSKAARLGQVVSRPSSAA